MEAGTKSPLDNPESYPLLGATIKEALRTSKANPSRFPRINDYGWIYKPSSTGQEFIVPPSTIVSCQMQTMHMNENVFPDPWKFRPERWLKTDNYEPSLQMNRDWMPFSRGTRRCMAYQFATELLTIGCHALVQSGILKDGQVVEEKIEVYEWMNSQVKSGNVKLQFREFVS